MPGPAAAQQAPLGQRMFARPPGYPTVLSWFVTGALRDWRGLGAALIATWFNLPLAIFLGGAGLVGGAIAGWVGGLTGGGYSGSEYVADIPVLSTALDSFLLQGGGILGLLAGAAVGAVGGFLAGLILPWAVAFDDPAKGLGLAIGQLLTALLCGVLYLIYSVAAEGWRMKLQGAREPSRRERELIEPMLRDLAARLRLGGYPRLLMDDSREPNAYCGARHIIVTRGFLDEFNYDPEPLAGVLCHELAHWRNADAISSNFIHGVALPLFLAYSAVTWVMRVVRSPFILFLLWAVTWPLLVCIRYFVVPIQAIGSRKAEYAADQGAVLAGQRTGLRRTLARFRHSFDGARNGWDLAICASHPPNELRLERIEEPGTKYPLPDADAPAMPLPVMVSSSLTRD
jgi:Zn-dependent protease with chaperone function